MGFRSTFTTQDHNIQWPQWFRDKYAGLIWFRDSGGTISSVYEAEPYVEWRDLPEDIQAAVDWSRAPSSIVLVYLHECGGITRCQIEKDRIAWSEPTGGRLVDGVTHDYCYGYDDV